MPTFMSHWNGFGSASGTVPGNIFQAQGFLDLPGHTILRTRAWAQAVTANDSITPWFNPGLSLPPLVLRVRIYDHTIGPGAFWPTEVDDFGDEPSDVIFSPLEWQTPVYIPPSVPAARSETMLQYATLPGGAVDSAAQRAFDPGAVPYVTASVNYLDITGAAPTPPDFNATIWVRVLIKP